MVLTGSAPSTNTERFPFSFEGDITGAKSPDAVDLSSPRIMLKITSAENISAAISWRLDGSRQVFAQYGARIEDNGTFSSFGAGGNPAGFSGAFYGQFEAAAGHVVTPHIYGTYIAQ